MERMVLTSDHCRHPVSPIPPDPDENGNFSSDRSSDDIPSSDLACHACGIVCESKEQLQVHHKSHFVVECDACLKFIGNTLDFEG